MIYTKIKATITAAVAVLLTSTAASAGGLERGGYNIDLLFDPSTYAAEAAATYVNPQREYNNVVNKTGLPAGAETNGVGDTESYWVPRVGLKAAFGSNIDCMVDYSQPWGIHSNPGANWAGAYDNIETKIKSENYAATCSYKFDAGPGQLRFIGGGFYQEISGFKKRLVAPIPGAGVGRLDLEDSALGWRIGAAYEIPEYAMRASLVYNSRVKFNDLEGELDLTQVPPFVDPSNPILGIVSPLTGSATLPDSLELKLQSGIAPDWLAFGSVKWTNWSILQTVPLYVGSVEATSLELLYRDGWTVTGGVGHKFNEQWSGALSLTWDRGTSTTINSQTDTWTVGTGVSYSPTANVELRLAGAVGLLTSGESNADAARYDFGNDIVTAISTSLKVKF